METAVDAKATADAKVAARTAAASVYRDAAANVYGDDSANAYADAAANAYADAAANAYDDDAADAYDDDAADAEGGVVLDADAAAAWRVQQAAAGRIVVFTNGCFDLLHAGHVRYLAWARAQGDVLVVGLNSDDSVRALKGPERPFSRFADRAAVLAALRSVDVVVGFSERTPEVLLDLIAPDIHVKSAQYRIEELPERHVVESHGGRILLAPHEAGKSTTDIVARVRGAWGG